VGTDLEPEHNKDIFISRATDGNFTPPAPDLMPEQGLNSVRYRALLKVAHGTPLSGEEETALIFGEHLL
jgi:hypothetical protein